MKPGEGQKVVTRGALAAAFAEWDRRYRQDPAGFDEDWHESSTAVEYGDRAADYLIRLLRSQGAVATLAEGRVTPDPVDDSEGGTGEARTEAAG